jgi:hypothetical protein
MTSLYTTRRTGATVVGIPARNEAATIASVASTADRGLALAYPDGPNSIVLADNGSDDTIGRFLDTAIKADRYVVRSERTGTGKGTNVFAIMQKAHDLGADRLVLLDADVRSVEQEWVGLLAAAVDGDAPAMAMPLYRRNRYEANSTNHLVRPLLAATLGAHLQQPIAGDFAFNRAFLEQAATWPRPASAHLYGIDVWLTANALREGYRTVEVPLGRKTHNSPFPKILHLPQQVLDSLFHVVAGLDVLQPRTQSPTAHREAVDDAAQQQDPAIVDRIIHSLACYLGENLKDIQELFPSARGLSAAPWGLRVAADCWPAILADSLAALADGEFERSRDHLIALYVNRVMTFWDEIRGLTGTEIDALLDRQVHDTAWTVRERSIMLAEPYAPGGFDPGRWLELQVAVVG